jgi:hypothetical protein
MWERMRALLAILACAACTAPESRTARQFLACLAERDLPCLRRTHAPLIPRLKAWVLARSLGPHRVGPYTRRALQDADNPFWAVSPVVCAEAARAGRLPESVVRDLSDCACTPGEKTRLAPREARARAFEPARAAAEKTHPALEVLANRSTAEALRVKQLTVAQCRCGSREVAVALLEFEGRMPRWRFFRATGICGPPDHAALQEDVRRALRLLGGEIPP